MIADSFDSRAPRRRPSLRLLLTSVVLLSLGVFGGGCASLTLATLGTVAGAAASAVSTGKDVYGLGKLDSAEMADFDQTISAAQLAAAEIGLTPKYDPQFHSEKDRSIMQLLFVDDKRSEVRVKIERRAWRLVRIRIDVGIFGSEVTARLVLDRLRSHLPVPAKPSTRPSDDPRGA